MDSSELGKLINDIIIGGGEVELSLKYSNHAEFRSNQRNAPKLESIKISKKNIEAIEEDEEDLVVKAHVVEDSGDATVLVLGVKNLEEAYVITAYTKDRLDTLIKEWKAAKLMENTHRLPKKNQKNK